VVAFRWVSVILVSYCGVGGVRGGSKAETLSCLLPRPVTLARTRNRLMHDGLTSTKEEAIQRHAGQAASVTAAFNALTTTNQALVLEFLDSL